MAASTGKEVDDMRAKVIGRSYVTRRYIDRYLSLTRTRSDVAPLRYFLENIGRISVGRSIKNQKVNSPDDVPAEHLFNCRSVTLALVEVLGNFPLSKHEVKSRSPLSLPQ